MKVCLKRIWNESENFFHKFSITILDHKSACDYDKAL